MGVSVLCDLRGLLVCFGLVKVRCLWACGLGFGGYYCGWANCGFGVGFLVVVIWTGDASV